ncbi:hypothetical protein NDU88_004425 [Pleurodeles waltl]|uniref:Cytosolic iron-sulfur assembly component 2A n=1 Tax=Pleurodeles waltl TaxID=8319 RepID=A0AAV7TSL2_PLEWA|nr:hypothetical protein NDU88_004425 [Pleurodeles waltl]
MAAVVTLLSQTVARVLRLAGLPEGEPVTGRRTRAMDERALEVYDIIRSIRDPEKPNTLEELEVVTENCVTVQDLSDEEYLVVIHFTPTVPHCSLATLIGLCLRVKLQRCLPFKHKLEIYISEGAHSTEEDINKQINDKERVAAAMENPNLREIVENCVREPE